MKKKIIITCILMAGIMISNLQAQTLSRFVYATAGNSVQSTKHYLSYTIGESVIPTFQSPARNFSLTQGFQQSDDYIISDIDEGNTEIKLNVDIYPNPARDFLYIRTQGQQHHSYRIHVYDLYGRLILQNESLEDENTIDISMLAKGSYLIEIISENGSKKALYKFIKL